MTAPKTTIKLHNTKTRRKEVFDPINRDDVRMYVCGPTVYDRAHIGNARPVIVFDVLYRLLRHVYGSDHVTYVRNFTDVDDKINATALARQQDGAQGSLEDLISERTEETIDWYLKDMGALGALEPDHAPRATQYIPQMVEMIKGLITGDFAYEKDGHVLFRVRKYKDYGALSGRSVDDMIAGARVEVAPYKEDPMDFVMWKPSDDATPGWDSPWGRGRPGWHIECSAMAYDLLGDRFDIHGGGNDLMFPHHENEIAQSKCAGHDFANVWLHNEMLQVEGKKMSKSLGNFFTVRDLLDQGVPGEVIRFVMLSTHYRKPMDWTEKKAAAAKRTLDRWYRAIGDVSDYPTQNYAGAIFWKVDQKIANDLDTPGAISILHHLGDRALHGDDAAKRELKSAAKLLGLLEETSSSWFGHEKHPYETVVEALILKRMAAREERNFKLADEIRDALAESGVRLSDDGKGVVFEFLPNFDPAKLKAYK